MTALLNVINCDSSYSMEERFLDELEQCFPKMKFRLVNIELSSPLFGCSERQTLKAGRKKLKLSWSPPISEIKDEKYRTCILAGGSVGCSGNHWSDYLFSIAQYHRSKTGQ